jgi:hypothetical protein
LANSQRARLWVAGFALAATAAIVAWFALRPPQKAPKTPPPKPPAAPARITGSELLERYAEVDPSDDDARQDLVLEQVAAKNMPDSWDDWVTVTVDGRKGTVVEFEVSPHGLRLGTNADWVEVPLDGPHSAAAAEMLGVRLATAWMVDQVYDATRSKGCVVHYFAATQIAHSLGYADWSPNAPDGKKMMSAEFFEQRNLLLHEWLRKNDVDDSTLVAGYFKCVVPPIDGVTHHGGLEMIGGHDDTGSLVQPLSGGFHERAFYDYSQNLRLAQDRLRVDGRPMTLEEFYSSVPYAIEFGFRRSSVPMPAYPYPDELVHWLRSHGYEPNR